MVGADVGGGFYGTNNLPNPNAITATSGNPPDGPGWGQGGISNNGAITGTFYGIGNTIAYITDGTSNTILIPEVANRFTLVVTGNKPVANVGAAGAADQQAQHILSGAGWADPFNSHLQVVGRAYDGGLSFYVTATQPPHAGPCAINCNNERTNATGGTGNGAGFYSYHTGGIQAAMCDGTVRFINQNIGVQTLIALITAQTGDIVGEF